MANELPEVIPSVQSMPTTGWFCQTSGNARKRVAKNIADTQGTIDTRGTYSVTGVPGHTHNASAVISVDANYSAYRDRAITIPALVWGYGALNLPVGLLTDSIEPNNAEERYERAIERCVGYTVLRPENCTGSIREPTRSIGEIRTLVTPKSRLDTLTYVEERRGWRVPLDGDDVDEKTERDPLVSSFPDVYIDMRPLTQIHHAGDARAYAPASLYLESTEFRYEIQPGEIFPLPVDNFGNLVPIPTSSDVFIGRAASNEYALGVATAAVDQPEIDRLTPIQWDGTLRFVWDTDERLYKTLAPVSITLNRCAEITRADGEPTDDIYLLRSDEAAAGHNFNRITVTFPILKTTKAFDGFCWLANMHNEEAINYAKRVSGLILAPRIEVDVIGIVDNIGPFTWIGPPAYRIPVGGTYAHPHSDILPELLGDGTHTDLMYSYWDKFDAFKENTAIGQMNGFLRYQHRGQTAAVEGVTAAAAVAAAAGGNQAGIDAAAVLDALAAAKVHAHVFSLSARAEAAQPGYFVHRPNGILSQVSLSDTIDVDFTVLPRLLYALQFAGQNMLAVNLITSGMGSAKRLKDNVNIPNPGHPFDDDIFSNTLLNDTQFSLRNTIISSFPDPMFGNNAANRLLAWAAVGPVDHLITDKYCILPATPLLYQAADDTLAGNYTGNDQKVGISNADAGAPVTAYIPLVVCPCVSIRDRTLAVDCDLRAVFSNNDTSGLNPVATQDIANAAYDTLAGANLGNPQFLSGWSPWIHHLDAGSNFVAGTFPNTLVSSQAMRTEYRDIFTVGSNFPVPFGGNAGYAVIDDNNSAQLRLNDYIFAMPASDMPGLYFQAEPAAVNGRQFFFYAPFSARQTPELFKTVAGNMRITTTFTELYCWNQAAAGGMQTRRVTYAELNAITTQGVNAAARVLTMYVVGKDWYKAHVSDDPYASVRTDSAKLGAVYQSIKRISQHICAPVINPNLRIGSIAPLNHDTRHLPPELRDFRLDLQDIDWGRLRTERLRINELTLYDFKDGNQKTGSAESILYLPQFREHSLAVSGGVFKFNLFSELGSPSYFCVFCRSATTDILQQPLITQLSISCETTKKKSNTITDMSIGQLYHLTQRNVHPTAEYDRVAFNRRQTVLLSAEDVGLLGLRPYEYQKAKRVNYILSGITDVPGVLYVVLVYNNRGLHIDGRRLEVVTLHE